MSKEKVRVCFVGAGHMGQSAHLRNYVLLPDCEVVALAEAKEEQGRLVAERFGIPAVYKDHRAMLEGERFDAIVASQPFGRHGVLLEDLLRRGKPVFIEKPLASSVAVGEQIVAACERHKTWVMVGYHKRSDPAVEYAHETILRWKSSGEMGSLKYARLLMPAGDWIAGGNAGLISTDEKPDLGAGDPRDSGMDEATRKAYGAFVNYYIHQVNLMRHLLNEPYRIAFVEPTGVLLAGTSDSGVPCVIEMSPYTTRVEWQESALVAFEHGWIRIDLPAPLAVNRPGSVTVFADPKSQPQATTTMPTLPWVHAMRRQAENFVAAVRGEKPPTCGAKEALEDLRVALQYTHLRAESGKARTI